MAISIKSQSDIVKLKEGGKRLAFALRKVIEKVEPGITTFALNQFFEEEVKKLQGKPSFKDYRGYPASLCTSLNSEIVHGIPSKTRKIKNGDLLSLDAGMIYQGLYTDMAVTLEIGKISRKIKKLNQFTKQALKKAISVVREGQYLGNISWNIQKIAQKHNLGIIRELTGHGVGYAIHEEPAIPNFGQKNTGPILQKGMVLAIEPMFCLGNPAIVLGQDGWTVSTRDNSISAHWEHTVLVQKDQAQILSC